MQHSLHMQGVCPEKELLVDSYGWRGCCALDAAAFGIPDDFVQLDLKPGVVFDHCTAAQ